MEEKTPPLKKLLKVCLQLVETKTVTPHALVRCLCFVLVVVAYNNSFSLQAICSELDKIKKRTNL